jgi:hypothetical protein
MTIGKPRHYSIGFVASDQPRAASLGSGTLVSFGALHGILTAAHVVDLLLNDAKEVGLAYFTTRPAEAQGIRFHPDRIEHVKIGDEPYSERGPDLAFLKLPSETVSALSANCSFLNLPREARLSETAPPKTAMQCDIVIGLVGRWDADDASKILDKGIVSGLQNWGSTIELPPHDGLDRLEFTPFANSEFPLPDSYGGTSGGALWRIYSEGKGSFSQARLLGIPFFQIYMAGSTPKIICHGPSSIYHYLMEKISEQWNSETAVP